MTTRQTENHEHAKELMERSWEKTPTITEFYAVANYAHSLESQLAKLQNAFGPINDWYQNEEEDRKLPEMLMDAVADMIEGRESENKLRTERNAIAEMAMEYADWRDTPIGEFAQKHGYKGRTPIAVLRELNARHAPNIERLRALADAKPAEPKTDPNSYTHYLCERCGGNGNQPAGCWTGKAYDSLAGVCSSCGGTGYLGKVERHKPSEPLDEAVVVVALEYADWCQMDVAKFATKHGYQYRGDVAIYEQANERHAATIARLRAMAEKPSEPNAKESEKSNPSTGDCGDDRLECSECEWKGREGDAMPVDFTDEPRGWSCPECMSPCAHVPIDEQAHCPGCNMPNPPANHACTVAYPEPKQSLRLPKRDCELGRSPETKGLDLHRWSAKNQKVTFNNEDSCWSLSELLRCKGNLEGVWIRARLAEQADAQDAEDAAKIDAILRSDEKLKIVSLPNGEIRAVPDIKPWQADPRWPRSEGDFVGGNAERDFWLLPDGKCSMTDGSGNPYSAWEITEAECDPTYRSWRECAAACRAYIAEESGVDIQAKIDANMVQQLAAASEKIEALAKWRDRLQATCDQNAVRLHDARKELAEAKAKLLEEKREWGKLFEDFKNSNDQIARLEQQLAAKPTLREAIERIGSALPKNESLEIFRGGDS